MEAELGSLGGAYVGDEWDALCKMFSSEDADFAPSNEYCKDPSFCFPNQSLFYPINDSDHDDVQNVGNNINVVDGNLSSQCFDDVLEYLNFHNNNNNNNNNGEINDGQYSFNDLNLELYHSTPKLLLEELPKQVISPTTEEMGNYVDKFGNADINGQQTSINGGDLSNEYLIKRKLDCSPQLAPIIEANSPENNPAKKPRVSRNTSKSKTTNTIKGKNSQQEEEVININGDQKSRYNCSSEEDDSNAILSQESNALNLKGKTRASRGSATDPQSLYARRRRERINERLRILQNLIPNGTKVDISTMLEDAVHYVKFLQLQIKLLSSDDLWMYAPIIHNGVDVGMYNKFFPTL